MLTVKQGVNRSPPVFTERTHIFKVAFFRNQIQNQEEKCVLRYFSASFQNVSMLITEDEGNHHNGEKINMKPKSERRMPFLKQGLNLNGKSTTFPPSELISQKGA